VVCCAMCDAVVSVRYVRLLCPVAPVCCGACVLVCPPSLCVCVCLSRSRPCCVRTTGTWYCAVGREVMSPCQGDNRSIYVLLQRSNACPTFDRCCHAYVLGGYRYQILLSCLAAVVTSPVRPDCRRCHVPCICLCCVVAAHGRSPCAARARAAASLCVLLPRWRLSSCCVTS